MRNKSTQSKQLIGGTIASSLVTSIDGICPHGAICTTTQPTITTQPASSSAESSSASSTSQVVTEAASSSSSGSSATSSQTSSSAAATSAVQSSSSTAASTSTPQAIASSSSSQASSEAATSSIVPTTSQASSSATSSSSVSTASSASASQASSSIAPTSAAQPSSTPVTSTPQVTASTPTLQSSAPLTSASATTASTSDSDPTSNTAASTPPDSASVTPAGATSNPTASVQQTTPKTTPQTNAQTTPLTSSQTAEQSTDSSSSSSSYSSILSTVKDAMTSGTVSSIAGSIGSSLATTVSGYITGSSSSSSSNLIASSSRTIGFHNATTTAPQGGSNSNGDVNLIAIVIGVIGGVIVVCLCIATRRRCLENVNKRAAERAERRVLNARLHDAPILPMEKPDMRDETHTLEAVVIVGNESGSEIVVYDNVLDTTSLKNSKATPAENQSNESEYREYLKPVPLKEQQKLFLTIDTVSSSSSDPESSGHGPSSEDEEDATAAVDTAAAMHDDWDEAVYTFRHMSRNRPKSPPQVNVNASLLYIDGAPQYEQPVRLDHYQMDALDRTKSGVNWHPADYAIQPHSPRYESFRGDQYQRTYDNVIATKISTPPLPKKRNVPSSPSPEHFGFFGEPHVYESTSDPAEHNFDHK